MTILDALKREENDVRVTCGNRWLVFTNFSEEFIVYGREYYKKKSIVYYQGDSEEEAIKELLNQ
jgi:hypothetical protein